MTYIPLLVTIIGVILYALTDGRTSEIGRIAFAMGLLAVLFTGVK